MILSAHTIRELCVSDKPLLEPFIEETQHECGTSAGLSLAGYDLRTAQDICLEPGESTLVSTIERFDMPLNLVGIIFDKSTYAREFIKASHKKHKSNYSTIKSMLSSKYRKKVMNNNQAIDNVINAIDPLNIGILNLVLFDTFAEPGWSGFLTVEVVNLGPKQFKLSAGAPICQVAFWKTDKECPSYSGKKYDNQINGPQGPIWSGC